MNDTMPDMKQVNHMGSQGCQIAEQNNYYGMSYHDTKELCLDLIKNQLSQFREVAAKEANERAEKLQNELFKKLEEKKVSDQDIAEEFKNPDMQYAYIEAQKAYIRIGTDELQEMLTSLLVNRIEEKDRNLLQIVLGEALSVVPMMSPEQLDILAMVFIVRYTKSLKIVSLESLKEYIEKSIIPFLHDNMGKYSLYQHLVYAKVGSIDVTSYTLMQKFKNAYPGLFLVGFSEDDIKEWAQKYPELFVKNLHDHELLQFRVMDTDVLKSECTRLNVSDDDCRKMTDMFKKNIMDDKKIKEVLIDLVPEIDRLFEFWDKGTIKQLSLSSVGIVLGAERARQIIGEEFDLSIWI